MNLESKNTGKILIISGAFIFGYLFLFIHGASAAQSKFESGGKPIVGREWKVDLVISTPNEKINTFGGSVRYPTDLLEFIGSEDKSSIINIWVKKPAPEDSSVSFAGITPGGYQGDFANLTTFVFKVLKTGNGMLKLENSEAYLNDGRGSKTEWTNTDYIFDATITGVNIPVVLDSTPPQSFSILKGQSQYIFGGQWFIAFSTEDKESGIEYYEVQENTKSTPDENGWVKSESPYLLKDQGLQSSIFVRAVDKKGNSTVAELSFRDVKINYRKIIFWGIMIMLLLSGFFVWYKKRGENLN